MDCPRCGTRMQYGVCPNCGFPVNRMRRKSRKNMNKRFGCLQTKSN